jgi:hypothetical protein
MNWLLVSTGTHTLMQKNLEMVQICFLNLWRKRWPLLMNWLMDPFRTHSLVEKNLENLQIHFL